MNKVPDVSKVSDAAQERVMRLTQEIQVLREREREWRQEREDLLQREKWFEDVWQEREKVYSWFSHVKDKNWSKSEFENKKLISELKAALQEAEARENLLLKRLNEEKRHPIVEIERAVPEMQQTQAPGEDRIQPTHFDLGRPAPSEVSITFGDFPEGFEFLNKPSAAGVEMVPLRRRKAKAAVQSERVSSEVPFTFGDFPEGFEFLNKPSAAGVEMVPQSLPEAQAAVQSGRASSKKGKKRKMKAKKPVVDAKLVLDTERPSSQPQQTMSHANVAKTDPKGDCSPKSADKASDSQKEATNSKEDSGKATEASSPEPEETTAEAEEKAATFLEETVDKIIPAEAPLDNVGQQYDPEEPDVPYLKVHHFDLLTSKNTTTHKKNNKKGQNKQRLERVFTVWK